MNIEAFYFEAKKYVDILHTFTRRHGLQGKVRVDHICYKCDSSSTFESMRRIFEAESRYLYQSIISGRRISYICLKRGIDTELGAIEFLELSDQKPDNSQRCGFDHIEGFPVGKSYDEMVQVFESTESVVKVVRPHHTTHDVTIVDGFLFRCSHGRLIDKIRNTEM